MDVSYRNASREPERNELEVRDYAAFAGPSLRFFEPFANSHAQ